MQACGWIQLSQCSRPGPVPPQLCSLLLSAMCGLSNCCCHRTKKEDIPQGRLANSHLTVARRQDASMTTRDNRSLGRGHPHETRRLVMKDAVSHGTPRIRSSHQPRAADRARQHRPPFTDERLRLAKAPGDLPKCVELGPNSWFSDSQRRTFLSYLLPCSSHT